jgi:hypothetical protein
MECILNGFKTANIVNKKSAVTLSLPTSSRMSNHFSQKPSITKVSQTTCSPDMALCDIFLFPTLAKTLKGTDWQKL